MSASKPSRAPDYTSGLDKPGLAGFAHLVFLVFHDGVELPLQPGFHLNKETESVMKSHLWMSRHFVSNTTEELETGVKKGGCTSMNWLGARCVSAHSL